MCMAIELGYEGFLKLKWRLRGDCCVIGLRDPVWPSFTLTLGDVLFLSRKRQVYTVLSGVHRPATHYSRSDGDEMTDEEIICLLKSEPITLWRDFIYDGNHRVIAMICRLRRGKPYLPLYYVEVTDTEANAWPHDEKYYESNLCDSSNGSGLRDGDIGSDIAG